MGPRSSGRECQSPGGPAGYACRLARRRSNASPTVLWQGAVGQRCAGGNSRPRGFRGPRREAGVAAHPTGSRCDTENTRVAVHKGTGLTSSRALYPRAVCQDLRHMDSGTPGIQTQDIRPGVRRPPETWELLRRRVKLWEGTSTRQQNWVSAHGVFSVGEKRSLCSSQ